MGMTEPLTEPPEWEGDDSINDPPGLEKTAVVDLSDVPDGEEDDDDA